MIPLGLKTPGLRDTQGGRLLPRWSLLTPLVKDGPGRAESSGQLEHAHMGSHQATV